MDITLSAAVLGVISSFISSLLELVPALGKTDARRAWTSIVVLAIAVFYSTHFVFTTWPVFFKELGVVAVFALLTYKQVLQPIVLPVISAGLARVSNKYAASVTHARITGTRGAEITNF